MELKTGKELAALTGNKKMSQKALEDIGYSVGRKIWNKNKKCYVYEIYITEEGPGKYIVSRILRNWK